MTSMMNDMLTITELARESGVTARAIRFYAVSYTHLTLLTKA